MRPTLQHEFILEGFDALQNKYNGIMPRGELFRISFNPYTGLCLISYQDNFKAVEVLESIFASFLPIFGSYFENSNNDVFDTYEQKFLFSIREVA